MLNRLTGPTRLAVLLLWLPLYFGIVAHSPVTISVQAESLAGTAAQAMPRSNLNEIYSQYTFDVNFDYDQHLLDAIEQVHFTNTYTQSISQIVFNVPPAHDPNQFILRSIRIDQDPAMFSLKSGVLTVNLPAELEPNTAVNLTLAFSLHILPLANIQSFASANLAYTAEATNIGYWYPILAPVQSGHWTPVAWHSIGDPFASDIASYTATITATPDITLVAGGTMSRQDSVWHYNIDRARTFGVFASRHYTESRYTFGDVTYSVFTLPQHNILAVPALITMIRAGQLYSRLYGAYPYTTLRVAEVSGPWSMEFSGLVALGATDFDGYDSTPYNRLFRIAAHEVSHQWWYNMAGDNQAREPWLDEGFARFNELRFLEAYSPSGADWWWNAIIDPYQPDAPLDSPIYAFNDHRQYLTDIYNQGAQFLAALRTRIGPATFNAFMRDLFQQNVFSLMTTDDFFNILREHTKADLHSLLRKYFSTRYWQR